MAFDSLTIFPLLVVFIFGICIGSFLNVCIFRIPEKKSIMFPASFCPNCGNSIPFYCNIPVVSFLFLRGRCKFCRIPISVRYPLIELLTGLAALCVFFKFGITSAMIFWFVFICVLITVSFIDIDHQIIPDVLSIPGIFIFSSSIFFVPQMDLKSTVLGILAGGGTLYAVALGYYLIKKHEGMGGGDIKLLAMIGAAVGPKGVFFTIFAASLIGSFIGAALLLIKSQNKQALRIPFGPFLSMGAIGYIFWGEQIINWYFAFLDH